MTNRCVSGKVVAPPPLTIRPNPNPNPNPNAQSHPFQWHFIAIGWQSDFDFIEWLVGGDKGLVREVEAIALAGGARHAETLRNMGCDVRRQQEVVKNMGIIRKDSEESWRCSK